MRIFRRKTPSVSPPQRDRQRLQLSALRMHLAAVAMLLLAFVLVFILAFPMHLVQERVEAQLQAQGIPLTIGELALTMPMGLELERIGWQPPVPGMPAITVPQARITPLWTSLFGANPGVRIHAVLPAGTAEGNARRDGAVHLTFTDVVLAPFLPAEFPYPLQSVLNGNLDGSGLKDNNGQGEFDLKLEGATVAGLETVGAKSGRLNLGLVGLKGGWQGRSLRLDEVNVSGGDLRLVGKGTLLVGPNPQSSRVTAQIELTPESTLDPALRDLLSLTGISPDAGGTYRMRISGTLANPVLR